MKEKNVSILRIRCSLYNIFEIDYSGWKESAADDYHILNISDHRFIDETCSEKAH